MNCQAIPALLALADGSIFRGRSIGVEGMAVGEVVFNTAMTGYQEILTDPSYARQIVTFTYPQIGNTGVNDEDVESDRVWASGLVIRQMPRRANNWRMQMTLSDYLAREGLIAIAEVDTRRLTRHIRERGALGSCIAAGADICADEAIEQAKAFPGLAGMDLAKVVSGSEFRSFREGSWIRGKGYQMPREAKYRVVAYDFGIKNNMLRLLVDRGCDLTVVPATTPAADVLALKPQGIFLSNGPGDPDPCDYAIAAITTFLDRRIPIFGICLGYQLLALASGAKTEKMRHGHHGANHPVQDLKTGKIVITSQNHGFTVAQDSLPDSLEVTHRSLFDNTLQGLQHREHPAFGFQGHPEASPGPQDCQYLFDRFIKLMGQSHA